MNPKHLKIAGIVLLIAGTMLIIANLVLNSFLDHKGEGIAVGGIALIGAGAGLITASKRRKK